MQAVTAAQPNQSQAGRARSAKSRPGPDSSQGVPRGAHEWVSFPDPDYERTWMFDVTFLESSWTCIFGQGCQGVLTGPAPELVQGCCSYGAHFTGSKDVKRVEAVAATLTPQQWQLRPRALSDPRRPKSQSRSRQEEPTKSRSRGSGAEKLHVIQRNRSGDLTTRIVKGACIFLNRPGFPGGPGCALHRAALERGLPPLELKPDVCWQLPLRRDDEVGDGGHVTSIIRQWDRRDWGKGGSEFHWWCTESPEAFVGTKPAYQEMENELVAMVGRKIYKRLAAYLESRADRRRASPAAVPVPHPAVRKR
jgi:hypothetical protein